MFSKRYHPPLPGSGYNCERVKACCIAGGLPVIDSISSRRRVAPTKCRRCHHLRKCKKSRCGSDKRGVPLAQSRLRQRESQSGLWRGTVPEPNDSLWVLVYLPRDDLRPAEFFVLTGLELHAILKPIEDEWLEKCLKKHGHPMPAVYSVRRDKIADHKDAWQKITIALGRSSDPATLRKASSQSK
jgi:hypothetical protein